jgi:NADPH:quinone reductase-like Zn-dependent oxidoreductase
MKAAIHRRYGPPDTVQIADLPVPEPRSGEIRVRVHATSVTAGDWRIRGFIIAPFFWLLMRFYTGLFRPRRPVLGFEFAGEVDAADAGTGRFEPGDAVFGECWFGGHAEYVCVPAVGSVAAKPANLSYAEAATVPVGALTALFFLRKAGVDAGHRVLINGASGGVGIWAVQLAKFCGAEVTGVCGPDHLELVRSLGADRVIDYTKEDFTAGAGPYDVIFDTQGKVPFRHARRALTRKGMLLHAVFGLTGLVQMLVTARSGGRRVICGMTVSQSGDLDFLRGLLEAGTIRPVVGALPAGPDRRGPQARGVGTQDGRRRHRNRPGRRRLNGTAARADHQLSAAHNAD